MATSGGEVLIDLFQSYGIEYIFCSPGSEWVPVWEGLSRRWCKRKARATTCFKRKTTYRQCEATGISDSDDGWARRARPNIAEGVCQRVDIDIRRRVDDDGDGRDIGFRLAISDLVSVAVNASEFGKGDVCKRTLGILVQRAV